MADRRIKRRHRVVGEGLSETERLLAKSARAIENAIDAVADDPEAAIDKAGEFVGRFLATAERVKTAYEKDPAGAKRELRNVVVGAAAEITKQRRRRRLK